MPKKSLSKKKIQQIARKAKARAYDSQLEAMVLYQIASNIGGPFGIICRHIIDEYGDIEQANSDDEAYAFLRWLPNHLNEWLRTRSKDGLVKASFITNQKSDYDQHWHIVADSAKRTVIETKLRRWVKTPEGKSHIARNEHRCDSITTYHWL